MDRDEALREIGGLARTHNLSLKEIEAAIGAAVAPAGEQVASRVFAYLGGLFVLAGLAAATAVYWEDMNSVMRITITLGSGVVCFVLALASRRDKRFAKSETPLHLLAALLQPTGLFVAIDEFSVGGDWHIAAILIFGVMFVQQGAVYRGRRLTVLLLAVVFFGGTVVATSLDLLDAAPEVIGAAVGFALLCIGYAVGKGENAAVSVLLYLVGSVSFLWCCFDLLAETPVDVLYMALSSLLIYISVAVQSRVLLATSSLALLGYIGYFTTEHFVDSLGWPVVLLILGAVFFGISGLVVKLQRQMGAETEKADQV